VALELDAIGADPAAARSVFPVDTVLATAQADLVFEAAPEDLATKRGLCATLGLLAPAAIVATVTERLSAAERLEALLEEAGKSVVRLVGDQAHPPTGWATARSAGRAS
jgi:3-hydroxyacyl-CoA dehydrogenase